MVTTKATMPHTSKTPQLADLLPRTEDSRVVLALDPGETTGAACLWLPNAQHIQASSNQENPALPALPVLPELELWQINTASQDKLISTAQGPERSIVLSARSLREIIRSARPDVVVMESYRVYSWKADQHKWQSLFTPRLIGALEYIIAQEGLPLVKQSASEGKNFCTDDKLKAWQLYSRTTGKQHARDALRHALHFALFGAWPSAPETPAHTHG
jgi:hypothetical protein